jgi:hypothetical protein
MKSGEDWKREQWQMLRFGVTVFVAIFTAYLLSPC